MPSDINDPLELLTNKGDREPSVLTKIWNPLAGAALGVAAVCFMNWGARKPIISGIQKHALFALGGGAIGTIVDKKRDEYLAKRDAVYRHYIELHPDDFPKTPRIKYADVLEVWAPIR